MLTEAELIAATPEQLSRYRLVLQSQLMLVRRLQAQHPMDHVVLRGLKRTTPLKDLRLALLKHLVTKEGNHVTLTEVKEILVKLGYGQPVTVRLAVPTSDYTFKKHPLYEIFDMGPVPRPF